MPEPTTFQRYAADALSPTVFQGDVGQKLMPGTLGVFFDAAAEGCNQAVKAWSFGSDTFPPSALPYLGNGRSMPRYPIDTALGLTAEVKDRTTSGWTWDGAMDSNWSRFWVVITGHPWVAWEWGDGTLWGEGKTWGSTATIAEVRSVRALVRKWKPAHTVCDRIIVVLDAVTWASEQPDGTWDDPANRSKAAVYWKG